MAHRMNNTAQVPSSSLSMQAPEAQLPFLSAVELKIFHTTVKNYKIHRQCKGTSFHNFILRDDAIALNWIFGPQILAVLEILDEECVTVLKSLASEKVLMRVYGRHNDIYYIPPGASVCQCIAFLRGKKNYCKHVLAAHFYLAIASTDEYEETSEAVLLNLYETHFKNGSK